LNKIDCAFFFGQGKYYSIYKARICIILNFMRSIAIELPMEKYNSPSLSTAFERTRKTSETSSVARFVAAPFYV